MKKTDIPSNASRFETPFLAEVWPQDWLHVPPLEEPVSANRKPEPALIRRPPVPVLMLVGIAILDLLSTTILYSMGLIEEMNPLMRPLLEIHPALFAVVKMATIVAAFAGLQWYRRHDERFVRVASGWGAATYSIIWIGWCIGAHI